MQDQSVAEFQLKGSRKIRVAAILGALAALASFSLDMYLPALPALAQQLHASTSAAQLSLTACLFGLAAGQLLAGPLSDRYGRRRPLIIGLIAYTITSILCAWSTSIWLLIGLRFVQGVAGSAGVVISRAMARDLFSGAALIRFFSLLMLVNGAGPIFAPILGGQLNTLIAWQGIFWVLAGAGIVLLLGVSLQLPETLPLYRRLDGGLSQALDTLKQLLRDRVFMGYGLAQGFVLAAMFAYISGSTFILQDIYGLSTQVFSFIFALNGAGLIVAGQLTGRLAHQIVPEKLFILGIVAAFVGGLLLLAAILLSANLVTVLIAFFLIVSSVGIVTTTGFSLAMHKYGEVAGSASALLGVLSFVLGGLAAPLSGLGGNHSALPLGIVIAIAQLAALLSYIFLLKRRPFV